MPPDRFDDVEFRIIDEPEPTRPPRRRRRWLVAGGAAVLTAGALAAGASALTGGEDRAPAAKPAVKEMRYHHGWGRHHGCRKGDRRPAPEASGVRY